LFEVDVRQFRPVVRLVVLVAIAIPALCISLEGGSHQDKKDEKLHIADV
jgi:hypothetical protein